MSALRIARNHTRALSQKFRAGATQTRSFYSPFTVLSQNSHLTNPPASSSTVYDNHPESESSEPDYTPRTVYVVSEPDPSDAPYAVPAGAYPTSAPYVNFPHTEAPDARGAPVSSTSPDRAHPTLTRRVPHNETGVGDSAAVRHGEAPGEMGRKGGGRGGTGMMDQASTKEGEGELAERNPPPIQEVGEKYSKLGLDEAWKARK